MQLERSRVECVHAAEKVNIVMASSRVALVTGANQGIGLEIVRQLSKKFDGVVLLSARNRGRGEAAVKQLEEEGLQPVPEFLPLDVDSEESIRAAKETVEKKYGRLDVLINNAAVHFNNKSGLSQSEKAEKTIKTNYFGVLNVTDTFTSLLQPNSRIVHVSSGSGSLHHLSKAQQEKVLASDLTIDALSALMKQFVIDSKGADYASKGWPPADGDYTAYSVSKIGVNRLAELQARIFSTDSSKPTGVLVNAVCPGWVRTRMGTSAATRSPEEGADTPVYLALLPPGTTHPNGDFLRDRAPAQWKSK